MHEQSIFGAQLKTHLADGFKEREGFNVADGAADFDDDHVNTTGNFFYGGFDLVGDVGNDLDGFAEVIAAPFFSEDGFVNAASGPVIVAGKLGVSETLVMAEIEIGFRAVFGNEDFAVLEGAHGAGIDVKVRVALLQGDFEAAALKKTADRGGSYAFSQRGNNTAGNKNIFWRHPCKLTILDESFFVLRGDVQGIMFGDAGSVKWEVF